jgi:transcriptional regulator with XRE-family HTH domain
MPDASDHMPTRAYSFVRAHRRRWGLTQTELAALLGVESSTTISRIERSVRRPTAPNVVAYSVLFDVPASELFASLHGQIKESVSAAAKRLYDELEQKGDSQSLRKREFLEEVLVRVASPNRSEKI